MSIKSDIVNSLKEEFANNKNDDGKKRIDAAISKYKKGECTLGELVDEIALIMSNNKNNNDKAVEAFKYISNVLKY